MPFDRAHLRLERFRMQMSYDAAFNYWNVEGVLAERWAHGPVFGGYAKHLGEEQIVLRPPPTADTRLEGVYGIKESWIQAEGPLMVDAGRAIALQWFADVFEVLQPRRVKRFGVQLFGLYPVDNAEQASRRLRGHFYRNDNLVPVLPERLANERDRFHSAVNFIVPTENQQVSVIAGAVGPIHTGTFFSQPDAERDAQWWMGINFTINRTSAEDESIDQPLDEARITLNNADEDFEHVASVVLRACIP